MILKKQADPADWYMAVRQVSPAEFGVSQSWGGLHNTRPTGT